MEKVDLAKAVEELTSHEFALPCRRRRLRT